MPDTFTFSGSNPAVGLEALRHVEQHDQLVREKTRVVHDFPEPHLPEQGHALIRSPKIQLGPFAHLLHPGLGLAIAIEDARHAMIEHVREDPFGDIAVPAAVVVHPPPAGLDEGKIGHLHAQIQPRGAPLLGAQRDPAAIGAGRRLRRHGDGDPELPAESLRDRRRVFLLNQQVGDPVALVVRRPAVHRLHHANVQYLGIDLRP